MLTYDGIPKPPGIEEVTEGEGMPDLVECGENNEVWYAVCRSKRELRITNKVDGKTKTVGIGAYGRGAFEEIASSYGMGPRQWGAAWAALQPKFGLLPLQRLAKHARP